MNDKELKDKDFKKLEGEMKALIATEIEKSNLRNMQCEGGKAKWVGERKAAMILTHLLMDKQDMNFGEANRLSWQFVKEERCKPCNLPKEAISEEKKELNTEGT